MPLLVSVLIASIVFRSSTPIDCDWHRSNGTSFSGTISTNADGSTDQLIGRSADVRVFISTIDDLRVCAVAEGVTQPEDAPPSRWVGHASHIVLETRTGGDVRRLEITGDRQTWTTNGSPQSIDSTSRTWRDRLFDVLDATWDLSVLQGKVSSYQGDISTIYGERSTLQGQISSLRAQVSSMQGEIASAQGEKSSLEGEISNIHGHLSSIQGRISSEQGAILSLQATLSDRDADRVSIDAAIERHRQAIHALQDSIRRYDADDRIREVQRRIDAFDADGKVRAIQQRIREFDLDTKEAEINRRIDALDVAGQVATIKDKIAALDADGRSRELEARRDAAISRLKNLLGKPLVPRV